MQRIGKRNGPAATLLATEPYIGMTLAELEVELELPFEQILIDVMGPQGGSAAYFIMDDDLQSRLLQDSHVTVSSDGGTVFATAPMVLNIARYRLTTAARYKRPGNFLGVFNS